jgi:hypothetical protein
MTERTNPPNTAKHWCFVHRPPRWWRSCPNRNASRPTQTSSARGLTTCQQQAKNRPFSMAPLACLHFTNTHSAPSLNFDAVRWSMDLEILALWHSTKSLQHETSYAHGHKCGLCQMPCLTFEYSTSAIYRRRHTARGEGLRRRGHMNSPDRPR